VCQINESTATTTRKIHNGAWQQEPQLQVLYKQKGLLQSTRGGHESVAAASKQVDNNNETRRSIEEMKFFDL
jgi:hypothetical protein